MKLLAPANRELFQRFQTIRGEARCSDDEPPGAARRFLDQNPFGRGLEPFRAAEARLEGRDEPEAGPRERLLQQPRGLAAMAMIGIAEMQRSLGHPVKAQHEHFRLELERIELVAEVASQRADI